MILDRYRGNQEATSAVFLRLINLGLVQVVPDPNQPDQMVLDTRDPGILTSVNTAPGSRPPPGNWAWPRRAAKSGRRNPPRAAAHRSGRRAPQRRPPPEAANRRSSSPGNERCHRSSWPSGRTPARLARDRRAAIATVLAARVTGCLTNPVSALVRLTGEWKSGL